MLRLRKNSSAKGVHVYFGTFVMQARMELLVEAKFGGSLGDDYCMFCQKWKKNWGVENVSPMLKSKKQFRRILQIKRRRRSEKYIHLEGEYIEKDK